jgi:hypothetical protein
VYWYEAVAAPPWYGVLAREAVAPRDVRDAYVAALRASSLIATAAPDDDDVTIRVRTARGREASIDVSRVAREIGHAAPADREQWFEGGLAAFLEAARAADGDVPRPSRDALIPTLKSLGWVHGIGANTIAAANFVGDLAVVYAFDAAHTLRYARLEDLAQLGLDVASAQSVAIENLRARLPHELATRGDGKSFLLVAGGTFEASLVLLADLWAGLAQQLAGELVCCPVARDVLLVSATGIPGGLESLRMARARVLEQLPPSELITTQLLVRRAGVWQPLTDLVVH